MLVFMCGVKNLLRGIGRLLESVTNHVLLKYSNLQITLSHFFHPDEICTCSEGAGVTKGNGII